jgi:hypothetical protein
MAEEKKRGGARPNAGRKVGSATARTREIADKAAEEGVTPLEYMLSVMRDEANPSDVRMDAAKSAAPYIHPKLSSIEASVSVSQHEAALDELDDEEEGAA